jgi:ParB/RepB/Spo0J family partition protein
MARSESKCEIREFEPERVKPFPGQPRQRFRGIRELAESMRTVGQITPGKVTLIEDDKFDARLIDGERRLRACVSAGIPFRAEVVSAGSEEAQFEISLAANFGKQDHDCVEIAHALGRLQLAGRTIKQMADICGGKSLAWVNQHLSLLKLHTDVQAMLIPEEEEDAARLAFSTALLLANHPQSLQVKWAKKIAGQTMLEARRIVFQETGKAGVQAKKTNRPPKESFTSLNTCLTQTISRLGIFVDMPGADLRKAIEASDVKSRYAAIKAIDELTSSLSAIAATIESTMSLRRSA